MKLKYLLPLALLVACIKPDEVVPDIRQSYTFEIWQCVDESDLKLCYEIQVPQPGYMLEIKGNDYAFEIPSSTDGCDLSKTSVFAGDVWVTLKANGIQETKHLMVELH